MVLMNAIACALAIATIAVIGVVIDVAIGIKFALPLASLGRAATRFPQADLDDKAAMR